MERRETPKTCISANAPVINTLIVHYEYKCSNTSYKERSWKLISREYSSWYFWSLNIWGVGKICMLIFYPYITNFDSYVIFVTIPSPLT